MHCGVQYRDMPIKGAPPDKGASYGFRTHYTLHSDQNRLNFLNNWPIFIPKPPLESSEPQLLPNVIRLDLAIAPCAFIRHITVSIPVFRVWFMTLRGGLTSMSSCIFLQGLGLSSRLAYRILESTASLGH